MNTKADTTYTFPLKLGNLVWMRLWLMKEYPLLEGLLWRVGCGTLFFSLPIISGFFTANFYLIILSYIERQKKMA